MKRFLLIAMALFVLWRTGFGQGSSLKASYYHSKFSGRRTASGQTYQHQAFTAASNIYKLGTRLLVTNKRNGKSVIVTVNDRMASYMKNRVDLSQSAFMKIASLGAGVINVMVEVVTANDEVPEI